MKLSELGEFGLIERLRQLVPTAGPGVIVGIGDDTAVLETTGGTQLLATCDMLVEGEHFLVDRLTPFQLGWKALAVNVSDIAAMAGLPRFALISLGIPPHLEAEYLDDLYRGLAALAQAHGVILVGGDTVRSRRGLVVDITVLGEVPKGGAVLRSGARVGDLVLVTGQLGDSAGGLEFLLQGPAGGRGFLPQEVGLIKAHLEPRPRVREAQAAVRAGRVTAMDDISDGLASEIREITGSSGVGARLWVERIPISPALQTAARAWGKPALDFALFGGEDYELVLTVPPTEAEAVAEAIQKETGTRASLIGEILPAHEGLQLESADGSRVGLTRSGWDHFLGDRSNQGT
ncbi:MAG: thiamine-phosphate kinase [Firmicutes bacterium]|nr:thiamine-phosphate kinase [Bacillota bacterium]